MDPRRIFTVDQVRRLRLYLLEARESALARGAKTPVRDAFLVDLALFTGLRVFEMAALECGDLLLHESFPAVLVREGKGGRSRIVRIDLEVRALILAFLSWKADVGEPTGLESPLFYSSWTQGKLTTRALQKAFKRSLKRSGIEGHSTHDARHTNATYLAAVSGSLAFVQRQLGHASIRTTQVYLHATSEESSKGLVALSRLFDITPSSND